MIAEPKAQRSRDVTGKSVSPFLVHDQGGRPRTRKPVNRTSRACEVPSVHAYNTSDRLKPNSSSHVLSVNAGQEASTGRLKQSAYIPTASDNTYYAQTQTGFAS